MADVVGEVVRGETVIAAVYNSTVQPIFPTTARPAPARAISTAGNQPAGRAPARAARARATRRIAGAAATADPRSPGPAGTRRRLALRRHLDRRARQHQR